MGYFSRIFIALQSGYGLDFFYLDFPEQMNDSLVSRIYKAPEDRTRMQAFNRLGSGPP